MKNSLKEIVAGLEAKEAQKDSVQEQPAAPVNGNGRRSFFKKAAFGGVALGGFMFSSIEDTIAHTTSQVNRASSPSELKITDMRVAVIGKGFRRPIIRIDTN